MEDEFYGDEERRAVKASLRAYGTRHLQRINTRQPSAGGSTLSEAFAALLDVGLALQDLAPDDVLIIHQYFDSSRPCPSSGAFAGPFKNVVCPTCRLTIGVSDQHLISHEMAPPTYPELAAATGLSERTVRRRIGKVIELVSRSIYPEGLRGRSDCATM